MWRPKNWKETRTCINASAWWAYEAGADAIVRALIEKGTPHVNIPDNQVGVIVYIPIVERKKE